MKLMIIEDNDKMRKYIIQLVTSSSMSIIESDNGNDAIKLYFQNIPDAVIMDIELKELDGLTAAEKIYSKYPEAKIIFLTNYCDNEVKRKAIKIGCYAYILKENMHELIFKLDELKKFSTM